MAIRRVDPDRRNRILRAAAELIAEQGVAGTSHRKVAARADVPLGSMTYHFTSIDALVREVFTRFATSVSDRFEQRMSAADTLRDAQQAVVTLIHDDIFGAHRDLVLTHELYTLAARDPQYRDLTREWMRRSRCALERHFDSETARQLDALIEGLTIHRALDTVAHDRALTEEAVRRITTDRPERSASR